ncbi:hypothetical protein PACTADRAFT_48687 [Pachysolen tannophilus NRRL Y-2460]|uniref:Uncharacterized protein n=1 Tax=Pachysolen tannophilus NRRL Y-2460 TaxID=669874 RepID=A0A1E4TYT0_PACTA|nr:hypothetical protein PACTADRAFT_48687 [Pachysolen tannophilus NRRL Y-2460]
MGRVPASLLFKMSFLILNCLLFFLSREHTTSMNDHFNSYGLSGSITDKVAASLNLSLS